MIIIPHSGQIGDRARQDESERLMSRLKPHDFITSSTSAATTWSSPELSRLILDHTDQHIVIIIGGAYGVTETLHRRADIVWSLSRLVFPHQLVRLMLAEQSQVPRPRDRSGRFVSSRLGCGGVFTVAFLLFPWRAIIPTRMSRAPAARSVWPSRCNR